MNDEEISRLTDHLFRHESGRLVSVLTGIFGVNHLQWAEDVVQESLIRALRTWPFRGIPPNPAAWLTQTAKNLALDLIRREKLFRDKESSIALFMEQWSDAGVAAGDESAALDGGIEDARLQLMFVCCHPVLTRESQAALALKTLCGFHPAEIARAFLTSEAAIAKRLTRARQTIRDRNIPFEIPVGSELSARLDGVLQALYLLFNEGYKATSGESVVRADLCHEAIRLTTLLAQHPTGAVPRTHALAALMYLNGARLGAREDSNGNLLLLQDQDRASWDRDMIRRGMFHLAQSADGDNFSNYHVQAGIAACHGSAPDYESTDWPRILSLYDRLAAMDSSPIVALNRAVAVAHVRGPQAGLEAIEQMKNRRTLDDYPLLHAVLAEFKSKLNDRSAAIRHLEKALALTEVSSERSFLTRKLSELSK